MIELNVHKSIFGMVNKLGVEKAKEYIYASDYPIELKIESLRLIDIQESTKLADAMVEMGDMSDILGSYAS